MCISELLLLILFWIGDTSVVVCFFTFVSFFTYSEYFCFVFIVQYKKSKKLEKNANTICYRLYIVMDPDDFIFVGSLFHILSPRLERSKFYRRKLQYYKV